MIGQLLKFVGPTKWAKDAQLPEPSLTKVPSVFLFDEEHPVVLQEKMNVTRNGTLPVFSMVNAKAPPGPQIGVPQLGSGSSVLFGSAIAASTRMLNRAA
jgi:hypothetical protein